MKLIIKQMKNELHPIQHKHTPEPWKAIKKQILIDGWKTVCQTNTEKDANRIVECVNALEGCTSEEIALISDYVKKRYNNLMFDYALKGKYVKTLHPIQQQLLDKYELKHQVNKLLEEMQELGEEIYMNFAFVDPTNSELFYREFLDVRNLMQQIESQLDPQLLEKYEAEMFEKIKTKYLNK